eukprot:tig00001471_g8871.t1
MLPAIDDWRQLRRSHDPQLSHAPPVSEQPRRRGKQEYFKQIRELEIRRSNQYLVDRLYDIATKPIRVPPPAPPQRRPGVHESGRKKWMRQIQVENASMLRRIVEAKPTYSNVVMKYEFKEAKKHRKNASNFRPDPNFVAERSPRNLPPLRPQYFQISPKTPEDEPEYGEGIPEGEEGDEEPPQHRSHSEPQAGPAGRVGPAGAADLSRSHPGRGQAMGFEEMHAHAPPEEAHEHGPAHEPAAPPRAPRPDAASSSFEAMHAHMPPPERDAAAASFEAMHAHPEHLDAPLPSQPDPDPAHAAETPARRGSHGSGSRAFGGQGSAAPSPAPRGSAAASPAPRGSAAGSPAPHGPMASASPAAPSPTNRRPGPFGASGSEEWAAAVAQFGGGAGAQAGQEREREGHPSPVPEEEEGAPPQEEEPVQSTAYVQDFGHLEDKRAEPAEW